MPATSAALCPVLCIQMLDLLVQQHGTMHFEAASSSADRESSGGDCECKAGASGIESRRWCRQTPFSPCAGAAGWAGASPRVKPVP